MDVRVVMDVRVATAAGLLTFLVHGSQVAYRVGTQGGTTPKSRSVRSGWGCLTSELGRQTTRKGSTMTTTKNRKVKATVIGFGTAAALLVGGTAAAQAATSPSPSASAGTDRQDGPGASLTTEQRAAFKKDMDALKSQRDAVFAKYGLKAPTRGDRGGVKDAVSKLSASQQAAFKKDMQALDAKRDAVFAKYGLTPPARGERGARQQMKEQVSKLSAEQQAAFKKDMEALKPEADAVFAKYGLKAPTRGDRGGVKDAVSKLSAEKQAAFKKDMAALKVKRDAVFTKYGLTAPQGPDGHQAPGGQQG